MDYVIVFVIGLKIGAGVMFFVVRNNPKFLSYNAKMKIQKVVSRSTGNILWRDLKK